MFFSTNLSKFQSVLKFLIDSIYFICFLEFSLFITSPRFFIAFTCLETKNLRLIRCLNRKLHCLTHSIGIIQISFSAKFIRLFFVSYILWLVKRHRFCMKTLISIGDKRLLNYFLLYFF